LIELLDELIGGAREAAWPLIRSDFSLSYIQIGLIMSLPAVIADLIEPTIGILADIWRRRALILAGGTVFCFAVALTAAGNGFWLLLLSFILFGPASGAFVNVSQVSLMESQPLRREQNMARWTFAGSIGMAAGPLALGASTAFGSGWRGIFLLSAALALFLVMRVLHSPFPTEPSILSRQGWPAFWQGLRGAARALRRGEVLRWLTLLQFSNLMLDVLFGFLALYFVDIVGVPVEEAMLAVTLWTIAGLIGDFLVIPLLERIPALPYLRASAAVMVGAFTAFLVPSPLAMRLGLLGLLGLLKSGWYAILEARLYASLPGKGGTALAVSNVAGLVGSLIPLGLGAIAQAAGLKVMMWFLLAGPVMLLVGLPREKR
jgi:FSR family fosmidomycin resistance protein-like MFS transporter